MSIVAVAVEQVLIGLIVIATLWLPFRERVPSFGGADPIPALLLLGAAYLIGVIFDKISDDWLSSEEKKIRLERVVEFLKRSRSTPKFDPFPQDEIEARIRQHGSASNDWLTYLRGRIRISRGVAVFAPPLAASAGAAAAPLTPGGAAIFWGCFTGAFAVLTWYAVSCADAIPRTDASSFLCDAERGIAKAPDAKTRVIVTRALLRRSRSVPPFYLSWGLFSTAGLLLLTIGPRYAGGTQEPLPVAVYLLAVAAAPLGYSSWKSVTRTQLSFLEIVHRIEEPRPVAQRKVPGLTWLLVAGAALKALYDSVFRRWKR